MKRFNRLFSSLKGIEQVRIEPIIQTMMIQYNSDEISRNHLLRCVSLFFHQQPFNPLDRFMGHVKPNVRRGLFRSLIAGGLLLVAYLAKIIFYTTNCFNLLRRDCDWLCGIITWNEE